MRFSNENKQNRVLLAGVNLDSKNKNSNSMDELASLVYTAGGLVVDTVTQNRQSVDTEFFIGTGKVNEIKEIVTDKKIDLIVFNNQLSGRQIKNLNDALDIGVIDRNMLILDIFAMRAQSQEGKLQVELAQLNYSLPRLLGQGKVLDRQGAGIGTRGPGETKLELDRRVIRKKITDRKIEIEKLAGQRQERRKKRLISEKSVAIVGYTNAGKSTLMNAFTNANVLSENKLFATLDPVTRKVFVELGKEYTITDTVGFVSDLPHEFIDAFKSTLEEAKYADLLLHIVDTSSDKIDDEFLVVTKVLEELGVQHKPTIIVFNKIDCIKDSEQLLIISSGINQMQDTAKVFISAKTGEGLDELKRIISDKLFGEF